MPFANKNEAKKIKSWYPVARLRIVAGIEIMVIVTEILEEDSQTKHKILLLNAPLPLSGWIFIVSAKRLTFRGETVATFIGQLTTGGLRPLQDKNNKTSNAPDKDASQ